MKKLPKVLVFLTFAVFLVGFTGVRAYAVPFLQLDIEGGEYVGGEEETIVATSSEFILYALLNSASPKNEFQPEMLNPSTWPFYISAALVPKTEDASPPDLGSFIFEGEPEPVDVTADMSLGVPPGLPPHGIFPTYYAEFDFDFFDAPTALVYNTQDDPGGLSGGLAPVANSQLYYVAFAVDTSDLDPAYTIHFDLYDKVYNEKKGIWEIGNFAPFSHDAESFPIPEPATMLLVGCGLIGLAGLGRKKFFKKA